MSSTGEVHGLFWNSNEGDRTYDANSFEYWLKKFFTSGVFAGDLQVLADAGMDITVGTGYANVDGKVRFWLESTSLTLQPAHSTYDRIDTIVVTRDNTSRDIAIEVVMGAYSGATPVPTAPIRNDEKYQIVLAQILVRHGVTAITQAVITDTRPDTSICGYITGTVTEMDFSQFAAQFTAYYNEFVNTSENAYDTWFASIMAQAAEDKATWDAWYAQLVQDLHDLPEDTAEYLQAEIDEIKVMGGGGSIVTVTTSYPSFIGSAVTFTSQDGTEILTGTFDSNLICKFTGFKSVGDATVVSSDGTDLLRATVTIPFFGNYRVALSSWSATVNIEGDENLYGESVGVRDSNNVLVDTVVLSSVDGTGTFHATKPDTYTFYYTFEGDIYSKSLSVTLQTTYSISLATYLELSVDVYSAANDTVSYTGALDGETHTVTTDSSGHATTTVIIPSDGATITFTSSVGKDPSNLSNDFSKAITLTGETTEIKVMPSGHVCYWYGYEPNAVEAVANTASTLTGKAPTVTRNTNSIMLSLEGNAVVGTGVYTLPNGATFSSVHAISSASQPNDVYGPYTLISTLSSSAKTTLTPTPTQSDVLELCARGTTSASLAYRHMDIGNNWQDLPYLNVVLQHNMNGGTQQITMNALWVA